MSDLVAAVYRCNGKPIYFRSSPVQLNTSGRAHISVSNVQSVPLLIFFKADSSIPQASHLCFMVIMRRTNTTNISSFTVPQPNAATFTFSPSTENSPYKFRIAIAPFSDWRVPLHWHPSYVKSSASTSVTLPCQSVHSLDNHMHAYIGRGISLSMNSFSQSFKFDPDARISWGKDIDGLERPLTVEIEADYILWRNICSAIHDRDIYPNLASTPYWVKALFFLLSRNQKMKSKFLGLMLRIQLQSIFYSHDFHISHGSIPLHLFWIFRRTPEWAQRLQLQSLYLIAWAVMATAYWVGRLFLGMKGEYLEYTPQQNSGLNGKF